MWAVAAVVALSLKATEPVDYVNTEIGTISHLLVPCFSTVRMRVAFSFISHEQAAANMSACCTQT